MRAATTLVLNSPSRCLLASSTPSATALNPSHAASTAPRSSPSSMFLSTAPKTSGYRQMR